MEHTLLTMQTPPKPALPTWTLTGYRGLRTQESMFRLSGFREFAIDLLHPFPHQSSRQKGGQAKKAAILSATTHRCAAEKELVYKKMKNQRNLHLSGGLHVTSDPGALSAALCEHLWTADFLQNLKSPWARHLWSTSRSARKYACWLEKAPENLHNQILKQTLFIETRLHQQLKRPSVGEATIAWNYSIYAGH